MLSPQTVSLLLLIRGISTEQFVQKRWCFCLIVGSWTVYASTSELREDGFLPTHMNCLWWTCFGCTKNWLCWNIYVELFMPDYAGTLFLVPAGTFSLNNKPLYVLYFLFIFELFCSFQSHYAHLSRSRELAVSSYSKFSYWLRKLLWPVNSQATTVSSQTTMVRIYGIYHWEWTSDVRLTKS